jgi:hypothetical protein
MKSVIHEASSIAKAVDQAWEKAGKPKEFSIKVLELPEKNFLGFTKRSAKISLLFDFESKTKTKFAKSTVQKTTKTFTTAKISPEMREKKTVQTQYRPLWNQEMINYTSDWLRETLNNMNLKQVTFLIEPSEYYLRIKFSEKLLTDQIKEKKLFASFAHLIIESLKKRFKSNFRGHKIVILHTHQIL